MKPLYLAFRRFPARALSKVGFVMIYEWHMSQVIFKSDTYLPSTISHFPYSTVKHKLKEEDHFCYELIQKSTNVLKKSSPAPSTALLTEGRKHSL